MTARGAGVPTRARLASFLRHRVARDDLARALRDCGRATGVPVWLVGGYVRDAALGRGANDVDGASGPGTIRLVNRLASHWNRRAFRFRRRAITTWRFVVDGRRVDLVDAGRRGLEEDLFRRELTINAIAFDPLEARLVDPTGGLADLRGRRLRAPRAGTFLEDPVRALRVARFMAELPGFRLHPAARDEASRLAPRLRKAAVERTREELDKLLSAIDPRRGLQLLERMKLIDAVLPELAPLRGCRAGAGRPDVWRHTLDAIALAARPSRLPAAAAGRRPATRRILCWALLLHDISKPETLALAPDGRPTFHGHEVLGARRGEALLRRLRLPKKERQRICGLILNHLRPGHLADAGAPARGLRRLVREAGPELPLLVLHAACDARASGSPDAAARWRRLRRVLEDLLELGRAAVREPLPRLIGGRDLIRTLGLEPGPPIGRILERIRERQEEGAIRTREQALEFAAGLATRLRRAERDRP